MKAIAGVLALTLLAGCRVAKRDAQTDSTAIPLSVRYDQHLLADGKLPPGATLTNPYAGQATSAAEGAKLFNSMNCDGCHGGGATGWVGPGLSDGRWIYGGSDVQLFSTIAEGRPNGMPAWGAKVGEDQIWQIIAYLRTLGTDAEPVKPPTPPN